MMKRDNEIGGKKGGRTKEAKEKKYKAIST
jgi:hypothetical protein